MVKFLRRVEGEVGVVVRVVRKVRTGVRRVERGVIFWTFCGFDNGGGLG